MNRRESILVSVLAGVLVAAAALTAIVLQLERRGEVRQRITVMEKELARLSERGGDEAALRRERDLLLAERSREREWLYEAREMDTYRFGAIVRALLIREGLRISRYRTLEVSRQTFLEFTVSGSALETARFHKRVTDSERLWIVPVLSIDAHGAAGELRSVFRIGYETIAPVDR